MPREDAAATERAATMQAAFGLWAGLLQRYKAALLAAGFTQSEAMELTRGFQREIIDRSLGKAGG